MDSNQPLVFILVVKVATKLQFKLFTKLGLKHTTITCMVLISDGKSEIDAHEGAISVI